MKVLYFPMLVKPWESIKIQVLGLDSKIDYSELSSGGFIPTYSSVEELKRSHPGISDEDIFPVIQKEVGEP